MGTIFTVSLNFLEKLKRGEEHFLNDILFEIINTRNSFKVAVDNNGLIITKYESVTNNRDIIKTWIEMLSYNESSIETVNVDLNGLEDKDEVCLALCSNTNGAKQLIIHSNSSWNGNIDEENNVMYNGKKVRLFDKEEASDELNKHSSLAFIDSIFAGGNMKNVRNH